MIRIEQHLLRALASKQLFWALMLQEEVEMFPGILEHRRFPKSVRPTQWRKYGCNFHPRYVRELIGKDYIQCEVSYMEPLTFYHLN